jgi:hypothetical protein
MNANAIVAPLPVLAAVVAGVNRAEKRAGKYGSAGALEDDRADMFPAQRALRLAPLFLAHPLEEYQTILGAHPELPRRFLSRIHVGSAVRQCDSHVCLLGKAGRSCLANSQWT